MQAKGNDDQPKEHPLRVARREADGGRGLTQQQLADAAGTNRRTVIRTESDTEPLVTTAIRLARGVDKSVEEIWGGEV